MNYEPYRKAIYKRVCLHCVEIDSDGKCTRPEELKCGVELYLPQIVDVVHQIKSSKMSDYVDRLREVVCKQCCNQDSHGNCHLRSNVDCGLDRYFEMIIEAVEEVDAKKK